MSVPIVEGMTDLEGFTTYIKLNSQTQQIEYLDQLSDLGVETTESIGDGIIDYHGPLNFKIEGWQPELTGGTQVGATAVEVSATATGYEVATGAGTVGAVSLIEMLGGILAGLGLGIASYELNKDFWIDVSNNLFLNIPGYVPITYENIEDMSIMTLFSDNKTYVDYALIQTINNRLIQMGAFDTSGTEVELQEITTPGMYNINSVPINEQNLRIIGNNMVDSMSDFPAMFKTVAKMCITGAVAELASHYQQALSNANIAHIRFSGVDDTTWANSQIAVNIRLFHADTMPLVYNVTSEDIGTDTNGNKYAYVSDERRGLCNVYCYYYIDQNGQINGPNVGSSDIGTIRHMVGYRHLSDVGYWDGSTLNKVIREMPVIPQLTPLQPRTISTTPGAIPHEMVQWWTQKKTLRQVDTRTGSETAVHMLPVTVPKTSPKTQPVTTPQLDIQTGTTPDTNKKPIADMPVKVFPKIEIPIIIPTPTPEPTPPTPVIPPIGGDANALFTVYNPSKANLNSLGSVLWSSNIIQQIVQMFTNNPLDAIISLHILYATPTTGANKEIKLGYVPTGVSCPEVTNQYVNVSCGTVRVPEIYGDVRDYADTDVSIYLPMIGIRQLKTEDVIGSRVSVDYRVDVFTGTVLATITISKPNVAQVLYTFEGNCAVNLPLTGADKSRQLATAVGAIGAVATGNPLMGMASAAAIAGGGARASIQRSGNFSGNAGAMGCKKPYLIIATNIPYDAAAYETQYGYPANLTVMLGTCSGYVKAKEVHADTIANATEQEKRDIENQLKQGIIIH